ncbi:MAG: C4-dicarboxylate ABC transporter substrate-binding protein [Burkholderiales bacterium]|nr:C4-dicarboxylate ABC transporter substrate-binding protein [Burkholderiales bacterium]
MRNPAQRITAAAILAAFALTSGAALAAEVNGPKIEWKFSTWGKARAFTVGIETLAAIVDRKTGGNFTIRVGYGEAFSKDRENLDSIKINAIDGAHFCNFYHPGKNPAFMVFSLPFLPLGDWNVSLKVRETLFKHPALVADMDHWNAMAYASTLLPQYEFLGKGAPPVTLEGWKGKRVRAGGGLGDAMEILGAIKTTTTATEVYTSMQRGTMDAASFPYTYAQVAYKIPEVSDWFTTNMSPGTSECPIVFSKSSWAKLPEQYRKLVMDSKAEVSKVQIQAYEEIDKKNLPMLHKKLKPVTYTDAQLKEFRKVAGKPVWDKWVAENKDKFDAQGVLDLVFKTAGQ